MSEQAQERCGYRFEGATICRHPAWPGTDRCVLHTHDRTPEQAREFGQVVERMLREQDYDFRGVMFPEGFARFAHAGFQKEAAFQRARFAGNAEFANAQFAEAASFADALVRGDAVFTAAAFRANANFVKVHIGGSGQFKEAEINGAALFSAAEVGGDFHFHNALIKGLIQFGGAKIGGGLVFTRAEIGNSATFAHTSVAQDADFSGLKAGGEFDASYAEFGGDATFGGCRFEGDFGFRGATVAKTLFFRGTRFNGHARFVGATVGRNAIFSEIEVVKSGDWHRMDVKDRAYFTEAVFHGNVDLRAINVGMFVHFGDAVFKGGVDVHGATLPPSGDFEGVRIRMGRAEAFCRFAKQVSQNMGEYHAAGGWHYRERCHSWYARTFLRRGWRRVMGMINPRTWIELLIGRAIFGYGEMPQRVIIAALVVILGFGIAYTVLPGIVHGGDPAVRVRLEDGIYFSIITFATVGFGDYQPVPGPSVARYFVMVEALAGAFLQALFVTCLARRWGRG